MNILVIGGNGFIGSHLIDHLLVEGHNIRVFDVAYERYRKPLPKVDYRISTLENVQDLFEALLDIDIVFHLASVSVPSSSNIDNITDINKNLIPTLNILNLCVKLEIKRIVYFSSGGAIYGNPLTIPIHENHPLKPISSYGIIKATIEMYLFLYQSMHNIQPLIVRPSNPYGPRQGHYKAQGVISTFLRNLKMNEGVNVFGDGKSIKDYIYIKDLIDSCAKLTFSNEVGIFNLGNGKGTSINEIIGLIEKTVGSKLIISYFEKQMYDVDQFVLDISKVENIVGKSEVTSMEDGIKKTWEWLKTLD